MARWCFCGWFLVLVAVAGAVPATHAGTVTAVAYRPDGQVLAVAERGQVHLLDAEGEPLTEITGLPPKVTVLAFSPDGRRLAVAAGRPGQLGELRVFNLPMDLGPASPPAHLFTLRAHDDLIHDAAFSPDGNLLATCGYDRRVKLWRASDGAEQAVLRDHSDAVYSLSFRGDGKLLASAAADRTVKVWDVKSRRRLYTLSEATDWLYSVSFSPDGKRLAAAGVDRTLRVWEVNETEGKLVQSAFAHERPILQVRYANDGRSLFTLGEDDLLKRWDAGKLTEQQVTRLAGPAARFSLRPDGRHWALARARLGLYDASSGTLLAEPLPTPFPLVAGAPSVPVRTPAAVIAAVVRPGDEAVVAVELKAGEELGVMAAPLPGSALSPVLELRDASGKVVAAGRGRALGCRAPAAGVYQLAVRDSDYRGGANFRVRLKLGPIPVVTRVFPLGLQRGTSATFHLEGVNLGALAKTNFAAPADAVPGKMLPLPQPAGQLPLVPPAQVVVGEFPEVTAPAPDAPLSLPVTINAACAPSGLWAFNAQANQPLIIEVMARRLGSPLDSVIEVLDEQQQPVPVALLRCVGQTFVTLRDHDSRSGGIRIENWDGFAINDYLFGNGELMRIFELPRNNDDDIRLFTENGQRLGYLGTTPSYHGLGMPLYRVEVHPPGQTFPPNGYPVFTLTARNDDGPGLGKDSRLTFTPPRDGKYFVRITDARGRSGPELVYRLTLRPPRPDFTVRVAPQGPRLPKGSGIPITVSASRSDGHAEPIHVRFASVPAGLLAPPAVIPTGENSTVFTLFAEPKATLPTGLPPLELIVKAGDVERRLNVGKVTLVEPGEIVTQTSESAIRLVPGGTTTLSVQIERRGDFKGRVPLDVRGLPHGVRVLDIGLNGILITEGETRRTMTLYCEPWVEPRTLHPAVVARSEKSGREYAARAVELTIAPRTEAKR